MSKANKRRKLYLLAGISPPEIRRSVCARVERTKQVERETHSLFGHTPDSLMIRHDDDDRQQGMGQVTQTLTWRTEVGDVRLRVFFRKP